MHSLEARHVPRARGGRPGRLTRWAILLSLAAAAPAAAQVTPPRSDGLGIGRFRLFPSLALEYTQDSNIRATSDDLGAVASGIFVLRPRLQMELPFGDNLVSWTYSPLYRHYTTENVEQSDRFSHFLDFESRLTIGPSVTLALKDHLVRGTSEINEFDPGGEVTFSQIPFRLHEPELELTFGLGARHGVSFLPSYASVSFDDPGQSTFFAYTTRALEARYLYQTTPSTTMYAFYRVKKTGQERSGGLLEEVTLRSRSSGLGLRRRVNEILVTTVSAAYESLDVEGGIGDDYSGLVLAAEADFRISDALQIGISVRREPFQSFFLDNSYYINNEATLRVRQQIGRSTYWQLSGSVRSNVYPEPIDLAGPGAGGFGPDGVRRRDSFRALEVGLGFRFENAARIFIGYNPQWRDSNVTQILTGPSGIIGPFDYRSSRLILRFETGWL